MGFSRRPSLRIDFNSETVSIASSDSSSPKLQSSRRFYISSKAVPRIAEMKYIRSFVSVIFFYVDSSLYVELDSNVNKQILDQSKSKGQVATQELLFKLFYLNDKTSFVSFKNSQLKKFLLSI